ncbi:morphogenic membrane protein MmpA [Streptomyces sp. NPDC007901]
MTTYRASESVAASAQPVGRSVTAALVLAVVVGFGWVAGMLYTVIQWQS